MSVLITGGTGFIGSHLTRALLREGREVVVTRSPGNQKTPWPWSPEAERASVELDILDKAAVNALVAKVRPTEVYHLAARSVPSASWKEPELTMDVNARGTIHLFEAIKAASLRPRVFVACSSTAYGIVPANEVPVKEDRPMAPVSPYGVSKVVQDLLAAQYWRNDQIPAIRGRIFNTTGPGEAQYAPGEFASRVVAAERAGGGTLRVGDLSPRRDITDVRDQVKAIVAVTRQGAPGEAYNLCSGKTVAMREVAEGFAARARAPVQIEVDPALFRPSDEPIIWGDNTKLLALIGRAPRIPFERTLDDMLRHARGEHVDLEVKVTS